MTYADDDEAELILNELKKIIKSKLQLEQLVTRALILLLKDYLERGQE